MKIGTCGFPVAREKYYKNLSVVEIQKSFYTPISPELAHKWRKDAPENFSYTLKAPQTITHPPRSPTYRRYHGPMGDFGYFKPNRDVLESWEKFKDIIKILNAKFVVFQTPSSFKQNKENVGNIYDFFNSIERIAIYGWEPRGSWDKEMVKRICSELNLIHIADPFKERSLWGKFAYYRLHGKGGYKYKYQRVELIHLLHMVKEGDYIMFNNTHMWENALEFKHLLESMQPGN